MVRHVKHIEAEDAEAVFGEAYWKLPEGPLPPLSSLLEIHETLQTIRMRLCQQGYLQPGKDTPYSRDLMTHTFTERTATRLHMWPEVDMGVCTDLEWERLLKDLPTDIEDVATLLSNHTGAEIWVMAAWKDKEEHLNISSATSNLLLGWLSTVHYVDAQQQFGEYQLTHNGELLSCTVHNTAPPVYGAFDGSYRPWYPAVPETSSATQQLVIEYLEYQFG
ncbi:hypothetical protein FS749_010567 [Ceratobasidium sp. UAMH 11750]|nr:hypothetical protein FS749_010567 [Ceratobasidium sp. UAMH 11750]